MLDEQVTAADLALALARGVRASSRGVVLRHVYFQLIGIGFRRWLPARLFCRRVEIVWEILRVGMANFPTGGKTCVGLESVSYANFLKRRFDPTMFPKSDLKILRVSV
jgi:hypothetical protein